MRSFQQQSEPQSLKLHLGKSIGGLDKEMPKVERICKRLFNYDCIHRAAKQGLKKACQDNIELFEIIEALEKQVYSVKHSYKGKLQKLVGKYEEERQQLNKEVRALRVQIRKLLDFAESQSRMQINQLHAQNEQLKDELKVKEAQLTHIKNELNARTKETADLRQAKKARVKANRLNLQVVRFTSEGRSSLIQQLKERYSIKCCQNNILAEKLEQRQRTVDQLQRWIEDSRRAQKQPTVLMNMGVQVSKWQRLVRCAENGLANNVYPSQQVLPSLQSMQQFTRLPQTHKRVSAQQKAELEKSRTLNLHVARQQKSLLEEGPSQSMLHVLDELDLRHEKGVVEALRRHMNRK